MSTDYYIAFGGIALFGVVGTIVSIAIILLEKRARERQVPGSGAK